MVTGTSVDSTSDNSLRNTANNETHRIDETLAGPSSENHDELNEPTISSGKNEITVIAEVHTDQPQTVISHETPPLSQINAK